MPSGTLRSRAAASRAGLPRLQADQGDAERALSELLNRFAATGVSKRQAEVAFASAVATVYSATSSPPPPPPPSLGELRAPATVAAGHAAFRAFFASSGRPPVRSDTQKFLNFVIEDRACCYGFQYNRVYALGLSALCDAFLVASCRSAEDEAATRTALYFALGFDEAQVRADAQALRVQANAMASGELLASEPFVAIAGARLKYTYAFGVGLVLIMKAMGETNLGRDALKYGARFAASSGRQSAIDRWCEALGLSFASTLARDVARPISIDGIGRFSFDSESALEEAALDERRG
eukprot:CAMPEP_0206169018 /NCGR_PEP_ID=MMETSP1474-20131121/34246_1 /ASSEMBLY_ACC=CAM_ASM_001110 /TAXON_ID=97495 /ORGANISM="Imantonia sp., Strain RCC918" /LENGTH=294 /DNA_ID=CAMNT_0053574755 /DNA_START=6 /DNA_END=890 /DNA_ORIENTATION=-